MLFCLLFIFYGCSNKTENNNDIQPPKNDSVKIVKQDTSSGNLEGKIMSAVMRLPEVEKINTYIDSISDHKKGVAGIMEEPINGETDYGVRVGYNGDDRFEVYNFFYVDPKTLSVKILDMATDSVIPIEEWRKMKNREN